MAILTLVGALNLPIIKFSVDWWNTLHQPASVFRMDGPTIYPTMLYPLLVMALAFTFLALTLHMYAMRIRGTTSAACATLSILEAERLDGERVAA